MKPKADLTADQRRAFAAVLDRALREIPDVRNVRLGRRVRHGANYEQNSPDAADYLAVIDFDDVAGLEAYLEHPAHEQLGAQFYETLSSAFVYDFEIVGLDGLEERDET